MSPIDIPDSTFSPANLTTLDPNEWVAAPSVVWWVVAVGVGVGGNVILGAVFLVKPYGRPPLQVDKIIGLLSLTGLATSLATLPPHLYMNSAVLYRSIIDASSAETEAEAEAEGSGVGSLCQMQGFLLNLLCLLSLWYTAVLALERYMRLASPHEHSLTFSLLNLSVLVWGVLIVLLIEVSGPIYGWAQYGYVPECGVCVLSPSSTHILTYAAVHTICYVAAPALLATATALAVIRRTLATPAPPVRGSQVFKTCGGVRVLCCAVLASVVLMLPYHVLLLLQAARRRVNPTAKVASYWLKIYGITCVYPVILLTARPSEVWPALLLVRQRLRRCGGTRGGGGGDPPPTPHHHLTSGVEGGDRGAKAEPQTNAPPHSCPPSL